MLLPPLLSPLWDPARSTEIKLSMCPRPSERSAGLTLIDIWSQLYCKGSGEAGLGEASSLPGREITGESDNTGKGG